jgi:hypothetical protein
MRAFFILFLLALVVCIVSSQTVTIALTAYASNPSASTRYTSADVSLATVELSVSSDIAVTDPTISINFQPVTASQSCPASKSYTCTGGPSTSFVCRQALPVITAAEFSAMTAICRVSLVIGASSVSIGNALAPLVASSVASATQVGSNVSLTVRFNSFFILKFAPVTDVSLRSRDPVCLQTEISLPRPQSLFTGLQFLAILAQALLQFARRIVDRRDPLSRALWTRRVLMAAGFDSTPSRAPLFLQQEPLLESIHSPSSPSHPSSHSTTPPSSAERFWGHQQLSS